jgi:hypothetical protein
MKAQVPVALILVFASFTGCATTEYMGPLDHQTDDVSVPSEPTAASPNVKAPPRQPRSYPPFLPKVVDVAATTVTLQHPGGGREVVPRDSTYTQVETSAGIGAVEGLFWGAALGAGAAGAGCSRGGCNAAGAVALAAVVAGIGALYGAMRGQTTTYVFAPQWP